MTNSIYIPRTRSDAKNGYLLATLASGAILSTMPLYSKPFLKQIKAEQANNSIFKDAFIKGFEKSGLNDVSIEHTFYTAFDKTKDAIKEGTNACYIPDLKKIKVNMDKAAISAFHEAGHAKNHLQSKFGKLLQKCRKPGYAIAGLMGYVALFSRRKPKEDDSGIKDFVQNNCGKIAFAALLPTVAEEALASHKGIQIARDGGLSEAMIKNLKKFYGKALLSYIGYAVATGVSVFVASKITEKFTRPKKIDIDQLPYYQHQRL